MNFFEFYQLPLRFNINEVELRQKFFEYSRKYHPDYHFDSSDENQIQMLEKASYNNQAYRTLIHPDSRIKYILELHDIIKPDENQSIPQEFLMEMMEVNEELMELEFEHDEQKSNEIRSKIDEIEQELKEKLQVIFDKEGNYEEEELIKIKEFYYKKRYLLRIRENLDKLAPL